MHRPMYNQVYQCYSIALTLFYYGEAKPLDWHTSDIISRFPADSPIVRFQYKHITYPGILKHKAFQGWFPRNVLKEILFCIDIAEMSNQPIGLGPISKYR